MNFLKNIKLALCRDIKIFFLSLIFGIATTWTLLEAFITIVFSNIDKYYFLLILIVPSFVIAIKRTYPKKKIRIELKNTNTTINIKFGDIFVEKGNIAIAVNEYFDSEIGKLVSPDSMHGKFIKNILGGKNEIFDKAVANTVSSAPIKENIRELGKSKQYPIGTTANLIFGDKKYLIFALSKTSERYEAYSPPHILLEALEGLLNIARSECNGRLLNIPLIGSGLSRSGIPSEYIIDLILISILRETKRNEITKSINIIIYDDLFEKINLNDIQKKWS